MGAFGYHFWSKYMPKISYYQKKGEPASMELVLGEKPRKKVLEAVRAMEMHMVVSCIAIGILQSLSICLLGRFIPAKSATREPHPGEEFLKQPLCTISSNIFSAF